MFVNDRRDNWHELLPFVMHAYRTSVHESTGYSLFRLMMDEECSLPQDVNTDELRAHREHDVAPHPFATWVRNAPEVAYDHVIHTLQCTAARRKRLYDVKAVNRKFPVGSWVLRYYPRAAQKKLGSPWVGPQQVVGPSTVKSLCASTVAFRPGSVVSNSDSTPSVIVSTCNNASHTSTRSNIRCNLDDPIDLTDHILSPFFVRDLYYQGCRFHSIAHLMCFRYAVLHGLRLFATNVRKLTRHLTDFPTSRFQTPDWQVECRTMLTEIYSYLCLSDMAVETTLIDTGPRPFCLQCSAPWGGGGHCVMQRMLFRAETLSTTFLLTHAYT